MLKKQVFVAECSNVLQLNIWSILSILKVGMELAGFYTNDTKWKPKQV